MTNDPDQHLETIPVTLDDTQTPFAQARRRLSAQVGAIITRRAIAAGISDTAYLQEIKVGRAPRITRQEAAREPAPREES